VPNEDAMLTKNTKVMVGDQEISGVTGVQIFAYPDNAWRAKIECICEPPDISLGAIVFIEEPLPRWRRKIAVAVLNLLGINSRVEMLCLIERKYISLS
jgi:hypothetical protein